MTAVEVSTLIRATPEEVWAVVMDPDRLGDWVTIHRRVADVSRGPVRKGFSMAQTIHLRGANFRVRWALVQCEFARRAVWEGRGPAMSTAHTEYLLVPEGDSTRFRYTVDFRAPFGPLGAVASRALVGGIPEREARNSLRRLKDLLERRPTTSSRM
jgi:carbon monoxide dehydrogenase subunit G